MSKSLRLSAALYLRSNPSSDDAQEVSERKGLACSEHAKRLGYKVAETFTDPADRIFEAGNSELRHVVEKHIKYGHYAALIAYTPEDISDNSAMLQSIRDQIEGVGGKLLFVHP